MWSGRLGMVPEKLRLCIVPQTEAVHFNLRQVWLVSSVEGWAREEVGAPWSLAPASLPSL